GIDMPAANELIAHDRTEDEVCTAIGADRVIYQDLGDLIDAVGKGNRDIQHFDTSCFSKKYITGDIDDAYLERTEALRNDSAQGSRNSESFIIGMQNGD
ncbi:MAG: amidophosphoribosyltransferase, partial [Methylobacter sp.]|nr:amidophosphoribosyltransferase [Methylobacter sp.]